MQSRSPAKFNSPKERNMKNRIVITLAGLSLAISASALAGGGHDQSKHEPAADTSAAPSSDLADGEVRKVDKESGKVTLKHGEIKSLDMPPIRGQGPAHAGLAESGRQDPFSRGKDRWTLYRHQG
jgi:Cu/Ag efflux protein CusF